MCNAKGAYLVGGCSATSACSFSVSPPYNNPCFGEMGPVCESGKLTYLAAVEIVGSPTHNYSLQIDLFALHGKGQRGLFGEISVPTYSVTVE